MTALVSVCLGIVAADVGVLWFPAWACFAGAVVVVLAAGVGEQVARRAWIGAGLAIGLVWVGGGMYALRVREAPTGFLGDRWAAHAPGEPLLATIEGMVLSGPEPIRATEGELARFVRWEPGVVFVLRADRLITDGASEASGDVRCVIRDWSITGGEASWVRVGSRVRVTGLALAARSVLNPGEASAWRRARQSREAGVLSVSSPELVVPAPGSWASRGEGAVRAALEEIRRGAAGVLEKISRLWGAQAGATASALLLGLSEPGLEEVRDSFTRLGILHALAISGFHLSVLTFMTVSVLRGIGRGGGPGWLEPGIVGALLLLYALILPAHAPIVRAVMMGMVLLGSESAGRRYDRLTVLCWAATVLLIWRPADLWSLGFQLSCGLTGLLLWLGTPAYTRLWGVSFVVPGVRSGGVLATVKHWVRASVSSSLLCWLASAPVVWAQTGYLSPLAVVATVLVSPVLVLAMGAGYVVLIVSAILGWAFPLIGEGGAWTVGLFVRIAIGLADLIDRVPGAGLTGPPIHGWAAAFATASVVLFFALGRRRLWAGWVLLSVSVGVCAASIAASTGLRQGTVARIDTFAVGDGSCHLVRMGGDAVLWDAGSMQYARAQRTLPRALRAVGAWRIATAVVTHGDFDHFGVLPELAEQFGIRRILVGERFIERAREVDSAAAELVARLGELGIEVRQVSAGDVVRLDGGTLTFLSPPRGTAFDRENDYSLIARLDAGAPGVRALAVLTGDAQSPAIGGIRDREPTMMSDWVEAPHHGAANAEAAAWVVSMRPVVVVQSTGAARIQSALWRSVWAPATESFVLYQTPVHGAAFAEFTREGIVRHGSTR